MDGRMSVPVAGDLSLSQNFERLASLRASHMLSLSELLWRCDAWLSGKVMLENISRSVPLGIAGGGFEMRQIRRQCP
jgi:hypothetical protein